MKTEIPHNPLDRINLGLSAVPMVFSEPFQGAGVYAGASFLHGGCGCLEKIRWTRQYRLFQSKSAPPTPSTSAGNLRSRLKLLPIAAAGVKCIPRSPDCSR